MPNTLLENSPLLNRFRPQTAPYNPAQPRQPVSGGGFGQQQIATGQQVQGLNAPNQSGVFGNTQYTYNPNGGISGVNTSLNPAYQGVENTLLGGLGTNPGDVSKAVYGQYQANLDPQWQTSEMQIRDRLANQGIPENSAAYDQAMDDFQRQKSAAYLQANQQAQLAGGQEQSRLLGGLFGLGQAATAGYQNVPQIATPDIYAYALDAANRSQAGTNSRNAGLFGLGSSIIGAAGQSGGFGNLFGFG